MSPAYLILLSAGLIAGLIFKACLQHSRQPHVSVIQELKRHGRSRR